MPIVDHDVDKARISDAADVLNDCPVVDVYSWTPHGMEDFHPDVGEYWRPGHVHVKADMSDMAVLRVLSSVMDDHGLKVHVHHGRSECGDDWARLVVDHGG